MRGTTIHQLGAICCLRAFCNTLICTVAEFRDKLLIFNVSGNLRRNNITRMQYKLGLL